MIGTASVPLRPLGLVELLDGAVRLVRHNAAASFALALPFALARTAAVAAVALAATHSDDTQTDQLLTLLAATALFGTMRTGLLAPVYSADLVGSHVGTAAALRRAGGRVGALAVLGVVVMLAQSAGALALGVAGVWLWGVWALAAPALVIERTGPFAALSRSFELVRGAFWRTWSLRALGWVVTYVLAAVASVPFELLASALTGTNPLEQAAQGVDDPQVFILVTAIGTLLAATVVGPVGSAVDVLLYADRRARREGVDIVLALPPQPTPQAPPAAVSAW